MIKKYLLRINISHLWALTVLIGIFMFINTRPIIPNDFWWHMAIGRDILQTGSIPMEDIYSHTMSGEPFSAYQRFWLSQISLYKLFEFGAAELVIFIHSLLITCSYGLLLWICRKVSQSWRIASLAVLFSVLLGITNWSVRPQTISILLGVVYIVSIYSYRIHPRLIWLVTFPVGMLIWVNAHGSFVIGLVLIGIWLGDEILQLLVAHFKKQSTQSNVRIKAAGLSLATTLLASLVNPGTSDSWIYVRSMVSSPVIQDLVSEWAAPTLNTFWGGVFIISLLISIVVMVLSSKKPDFLQLATFFAFGILALRTTRGVIWFGLVMAPILSDHLGSILSSIKFNKRRTNLNFRPAITNILILCFLLAAAVYTLPWFRSRVPMLNRDTSLLSSDTPINGTLFLLENDLPGELFNDMGFGSYLIWAASNKYKVFADPRIDLYPQEVWQEYIWLINAMPGWEDIMMRGNINTVFLNPEKEPALVSSIVGSPDWINIYNDESAVIFIRK